MALFVFFVMIIPTFTDASDVVVFDSVKQFNYSKKCYDEKDYLAAIVEFKKFKSIFPNDPKIVAASIGALGAVNVGLIAGQDYQGARAMGGQVGAGGSFLVGERGPEVLTMGTSGGHITPNHAMGDGGESNITIVNKTTGNIGRVTEQRISASERAIIIEEAVSTVNRNIANPNSSTSRSLASNTTTRRAR